MTTAYIGHDGITAAVEGYALASRAPKAGTFYGISRWSGRRGKPSARSGPVFSPTRPNARRSCSRRQISIRSSIRRFGRQPVTSATVGRPHNRSSTQERRLSDGHAAAHRPARPSAATPCSTTINLHNQMQRPRSPNNLPRNRQPIRQSHHPPPAAPFVLLDTPERAAMGLSLPAYFRGATGTGDGHPASARLGGMGVANLP